MKSKVHPRTTVMKQAGRAVTWVWPEVTQLEQAGAKLQQEQAGAKLQQEQAGAELQQEQVGAKLQQEHAGAKLQQQEPVEQGLEGR